MRVLVLGGDGFCGWPTSLYLSERGYDVTILDNLSRRKIDIDLEVGSLTPITAIGDRLRAWREVSGREIGFLDLNLATEYDRLTSVLRELRPDAIVHFAEQRAAPYSMRSPAAKRYTVDNNVRATHNLLTALVHTGVDAAIAHLGTMGVYGYGWSGSAPIPEGYLTVKVPTPAGELEREILHPANPGSVYHMTKTLDQLMFAFYAKNDGVRITDLHQGIVWGTQTDQTALDERLINRFDYDGDYGTVLNRFLMQAAIGHPLTVHGTGGQTRAFIHIKDTARVRRDRHLPPAQGGRAADGAQPGDRDAPGDRPRQAGRRHHRRRDRVPAESAGRGGGERPRRPQRPIPRARPAAHHAVGGAAHRGQRGRRQVRAPRRPAQDHLPVGMAGRHAVRRRPRPRAVISPPSPGLSPRLVARLIAPACRPAYRPRAPSRYSRRTSRAPPEGSWLCPLLQ